MPQCASSEFGGGGLVWRWVSWTTSSKAPLTSSRAMGRLKPKRTMLPFPQLWCMAWASHGQQRCPGLPQEQGKSVGTLDSLPALYWEHGLCHCCCHWAGRIWNETTHFSFSLLSYSSPAIEALLKKHLELRSSYLISQWGAYTKSIL